MLHADGIPGLTVTPDDRFGKRAAVGRLASACLVLLFVAFFPAAGSAETPDSLRQDIEEQKARADAQRKKLNQLTAQERTLHKGLAATSDRIKELRRKIEQEEARLKKLRRAESGEREHRAGLDRRRDAIRAELASLLGELWPLYVAGEAERGGDIPDWDRADREFVWTAELYRQVDGRLAELKEKEQAIAQSLGEQKRLADEAEKRLAAIEADQNALLRQELSLRKELAGIRKAKVSHEAGLNQVLDTISSLNLRLSASLQRSGGDFGRMKGGLPWPVSGSLVKGYKPKAKPPHRGASIAASEGEGVKSVSWGKVVHNDILRGFGRVIIVMHGEEYYTLYAYLASGEVQVGQEVKPGQVIGRAGYYPAIKRPGIYFELRFHQKAINPLGWLVARR